MKNIYDSVKKIGKEYWDLGLGVAGACLIGGVLPDQLDNYGRIAGLLMYISSAVVPVRYDLDENPDANYLRSFRNGFAGLLAVPIASFPDGKVYHKIASIAFAWTSIAWSPLLDKERIKVKQESIDDVVG